MKCLFALSICRLTDFDLHRIRTELRSYLLANLLDTVAVVERNVRFPERERSDDIMNKRFSRYPLHQALMQFSLH